MELRPQEGTAWEASWRLQPADLMTGACSKRHVCWPARLLQAILGGRCAIGMVKNEIMEELTRIFS